MRLLILILFVLPFIHSSIYQKLYAEAEKITMAMTFEQKIGQTIQAEFGCLATKGVTDPSVALKYSLGSVLINGDNVPDASGNIVPIPDKEDQAHALYLSAKAEHWKALADKFNNIGPQVSTFQGKTFRVKLLLGTDAVHGNQHVVGSTLFPHNSGLACSHNPTNFYNMGYWTGLNVKKTGFNYAFAPTVAVSHNPQWGRFYQTLGQEEDYIYNYSRSFVQGLQNRDGSGKWNGVLASAKHFIGDGSTLYGADQGDAMVYSFKNYIKHNVQGYTGAIQAEVGSVMVSYSAVNGIPMSINPMIQNVLKKNLKFDGFVISDYDQLNNIPDQQLPTSYVNMTDYQAYSAMLNAGIDVFMVPAAYGVRAITEIFSEVKIGMQNNTFDISRLNQAVTRIIAVKMSMGLVQEVKSQNILTEDQTDEIEVTENVKVSTQFEDSLNAVRQSLVLLKNTNNVLPVKNIRSGIEHIVLVGERVINVNHLSKNQLFRDFDNIGLQSGGWSLRWQGFEGNQFWDGANKQAINATSILDGLKNLKANFTLHYPNYTSMTNQLHISEDRTKYLNQLKTTRKNMTAKNTIIIGVLGESPYAETAGDVGIPYCHGSILGSDGCRYDGTNPYLPQKQRSTLDLQYDSFAHKVLTEVWQQDKNIPLITIMLAGRPMHINSALNISSAFVSGWLPGTSGGQGIVDAISGDYKFRPNGSSDRRNTLAFDWPTNATVLADFPVYPPNGQIPRVSGRLFDVGYGLST